MLSVVCVCVHSHSVMQSIRRVQVQTVTETATTTMQNNGRMMQTTTTTTMTPPQTPLLLPRHSRIILCTSMLLIFACATLVPSFAFAATSSSSSAAAAAAAASSAVQYLTSLRSGAGGSPLNIADPDGIWTQLYAGAGPSNPGAPHIDDIPLWILSLPFEFTFNSRPGTKRIFVSPNGFVSLQDDQPMCCESVEDPDLDAPQGALITKCFQSLVTPPHVAATASGCNFNSSYSNSLIVAFLADLNPGASVDARIHFLSAPHIFKIRWSSLPFYQREYAEPIPAPVTFQLDLFPSGSIVVRLMEVRDPNEGALDAAAANRAGVDASLRPWIAAALRFDTATASSASLDARLAPLFDEPSASSSSPELTMYADQAASWSTSHTAGAYIQRFQPSDSASVNSSTGLVGFRNDIRIEFCTCSVALSSSPRQGSVDGGQELFIVAADLTCFATENHQAQCRFYPCSASSVGDSCDVASASFLFTAASFDPVIGALRCQTPPASDFSPSDAVGAGNLLQLRLFDVDASRELVSASQMLYRFLSAADAAIVDAALPTLANPGPNSESLQLLRLGIYPLLCNDSAALASPALCVRDCAGVFSGEAVVDDCGVCSGGTSGHGFNADLDCAGKCFIDRFASAGFSFASSSSSSLRANLSYCICENVNLTSAVQSAFIAGEVLSSILQSTLDLGECSRESFLPLLGTLNVISWYRVVLICVAAGGFALAAGNGEVQKLCGGGANNVGCCCCVGSGAADGADNDDGEESDAEDDAVAAEEAAMERRERLAKEEAEDEEAGYAAAAARSSAFSSAPALLPPPGSSASSIAAPAHPVASPFHLRWHVEE